jgi:hypothetical protein
LIARQRANLRRTFDQTEQITVNDPIAQRLAQFEKELAEATTDFTTGLENRFGPVPCLHEAGEAMESAISALGQKKMQSACDHEETALANLIKARQNLRRLLSQNSSASECRKFDSQEKQKLRTPKEKNPPAQLQQEIAKLAQEERQLSKEIDRPSGQSQVDTSAKEPKNDSLASQSKSGNKSSGTTDSGAKPLDSRASLAERQEKAARKAAELKELVRKDEALTELASKRMNAAAEAIQASSRALATGQNKDASRQANAAAEHLERLARQVGALKPADPESRLANAQRLAQELAMQEHGLQKERQKKGQSGNRKEDNDGMSRAARQRSLTEEAGSLSDLLQRTQADCRGTNSQLGESLRHATEADPPETIVAQMGRAADAIQAGQLEAAKHGMDQSARMLEALARDIATVRLGLVQPQLEKLLAAEKQAAEMRKTLKTVTNEQQKVEAEKKLIDLRDTLESLKPGDGKLAEAANALDGAVRNGGGGWKRREEKHENLPIVFFQPPISYDTNVERVVQALQAKIQDIILKDVLLNKDEAVPPQYKAFVEEYYRVLSEDLR